MRSKLMTGIIVLLCMLILIGLILLGYMFWAVSSGQLNGWGVSEATVAALPPQAPPYVLSCGRFDKGI